MVSRRSVDQFGASRELQDVARHKHLARRPYNGLAGHLWSWYERPTALQPQLSAPYPELHMTIIALTCSRSILVGRS